MGCREEGKGRGGEGEKTVLFCLGVWGAGICNQDLRGWAAERLPFKVMGTRGEGGREGGGKKEGWGWGRADRGGGLARISGCDVSAEFVYKIWDLRW